MRFSEIFSEQSVVAQEFLPRQRTQQITRLGVLFVGCFVLLAAFHFIPSTAEGKDVGAFFSLAVLIFFSFFVVYRKQLSLDLVMATEYHNMLLSQATSLGSAFCMFVDRQGAMLYANDGVYDVFSDFNYSRSRMLGGILEKSGVAKADRDRLMAAIEGHRSDRLIFPIGTTQEAAKTYVLTVDPLPRPSNILLIRGREYYNARTGVQLFPEMLRATTSEKLDHLLAHAPFGMYITDAYGRFEYVNPSFEQALGYDVGEVLAHSMTLPHVLTMLAATPVRVDDVPSAFDGQATFATKHGTRMEGQLHQSLIRDAQGQIVGTTGAALFDVGHVL